MAKHSSTFLSLRNIEEEHQAHLRHLIASRKAAAKISRLAAKNNRPKRPTTSPPELPALQKVPRVTHGPLSGPFTWPVHATAGTAPPDPTTPRPPSAGRMLPLPPRTPPQSAQYRWEQAANKRVAARTEQSALARAAAKAARVAGKVQGVARPVTAAAPTKLDARTQDRDFGSWLRHNQVPAGARVFLLSKSVSNNAQVAGGWRTYLTARGLVENTDPASPHWDFKFILKHADVTWRKLRPWQSVNSFEPASDSSKTHSVTTKVGLGRLLASGGQWVGIDHEQFFPQQFDISDPGEAAAFIRQYQYGAAQAELRLWAATARDPVHLRAARTETEALKVEAAIEFCNRLLADRRHLVEATDSQSDEEQQPIAAPRALLAVQQRSEEEDDADHPSLPSRAASYTPPLSGVDSDDLQQTQSWDGQAAAGGGGPADSLASDELESGGGVRAAMPAAQRCATVQAVKAGSSGEGEGEEEEAAREHQSMVRLLGTEDAAAAAYGLEKANEAAEEAAAPAVCLPAIIGAAAGLSMAGKAAPGDSISAWAMLRTGLATRGAEGTVIMAQLHAAMAVREAAREFHLQKKRAPMVTKVRVDYYGRAHSHQSNATSDSAHRTREKRSPARVDAGAHTARVDAGRDAGRDLILSPREIARVETQAERAEAAAAKLAKPARVKRLVALAATMVAQLEGCDPQWSIAGTANVWVAKPAAQSRGRGITVSGSLHKLLGTVGCGPQRRATTSLTPSHPVCDWVVQKYVEAPATIDGRKWDARMWVMCTGAGVNLRVWFYLDGYLRLSTHQYDLDDLDDTAAHITNVTVLKTMEDWAADQHTLMTYEYMQLPGREREWTEELLPQMQAIVVDTMKADAYGQEFPQEQFSHDHFQLFGFDFIVSTAPAAGSLQPATRCWLLEVNRAPSMSGDGCQAASTLKDKLCADAQRDIAEVVTGNMVGKLVGAAVGRFVLLHHGQPVYGVGGGGSGGAVAGEKAFGVVPDAGSHSLHIIGAAIRRPGEPVRPEWWKVLKKTVLRCAVSRESEKAGEVLAGQVVRALGYDTDGGVCRVLVSGGWVSTESAAGSALLVRIRG